jgi:hypothetical protein
MTSPLFDALAREQKAFTGVFAWGTNDFREGRGAARQVAHGLLRAAPVPVLGVAPHRGALLARPTIGVAARQPGRDQSSRTGPAVRRP